VPPFHPQTKVTVHKRFDVEQKRERVDQEGHGEGMPEEHGGTTQQLGPITAGAVRSVSKGRLKRTV